jgi:2-polyprenyl-6-methoxyphenol hydroxylase-like FAD-dependent oxidoreductase
VLDCSGRGARSDRWLGALGLPAPEVAEVRIGVKYATQLFRRDSDPRTDGVGMLVMPEPPHEKRIGLALAVEGDRWLVGLGAWHGEQAPDADGFFAFAKSLPHQGVAEVLTLSEPVSPLVPFQFPSSRRRYFEHVRRPPGGYLAMGDAMCSFNPVYGQGMSCAAIEAVALGRLLDEGPGEPGRLARAFYREAARILAVPWRFAVGADFAYPETVGPRPRGIRLLNGYSRRLQLAASVDPKLRRRLFTPGTVARVIRGTWTRGRP